MTDDTTPRVLQSIQTQLGQLKADLDRYAVTTNRSVGNLANSILQLRTVIESQGTDIHTMALAVAENAARLAGVEDRLGNVENRLAGIENLLPATRQ